MVRIGLGRVNNLDYSKNSPLDSTLLSISPKVTAEARGGGHVHAFTYQGQFQRYKDSPADNIGDHELIARTQNQFSARADLRGEAFYLQRHEGRGLFARAAGLEPDQFNAFGAIGTAGYGAQAAQGRFEVDFGLTDKQYQNNRAVTHVLDVSSFNLAGRFLYRLTPRMQALAELRDTEINYKTSNFDSSERRALLGLSVDAAAAISGTVKFGVVRKNFKDSAYSDYSAAAAEVAVRWAPLTYTNVDFVLRRTPNDTTGTTGASSSLDDTVGAHWVHRWQSYSGTYVSLVRVKQSYRNVSRTDSNDGVNLGAYYDLRSWLRLSLDYSVANRRSSDSSLDYKRDSLSFLIGATL